MSTLTTNYEFIKPELTDAADITATNQNWDIIDSTLKAMEEGSSGSLEGKVSKTGDTLTGMLTFNNTTAYHAIHKYRVLDNVTYGVNIGCGQLGGQGVVALESRQGDATDSPILGRLEIGDLGVSYVDSEGKRTYLVRSEVASATVE